MGKKHRYTFVSLLAAAAIAAPAIGFAAAPSHFKDAGVKVSYADLDIHSKAGARVLYSRLKRASEEVCGIQSHVINGSLAMTLKARACFQETLEASVEKIDSDALEEIHAG
jgi:UrcA family protein